MTRSTSFCSRSVAFSVVAFLFYASAVIAADLESFEFNDATGTTLANAANTAHPGNLWLEDGGTLPSGMAPSDIRDGVYNIVKGSSVLESNYFQLNNITSGTYYLVARMSAWTFVNFDAANLEEFRLAFLDDDDANFGTTITAQLTIRRESNGGVLIAGDALGAGSKNIPGTAALAMAQLQPFTAVVELNKTSNTYRVLYKDNNNPTQVLGMGAVAPTRNGNSVRMSANNNFSDFSIDYPLDFFEAFSVDRIAVTDTNPFTDLISLDIDRSSGAVSLRNTSGVALTGLQSYSFTSATGSFNPSKWKTVAGNYDSLGNSSVDNAPWTITTSSKTELAEAFQSGDGGGLTINQNVVLNTALGDTTLGHTWIKSPFEDVQAVLNFAGGVTRTVYVNFTGNSGKKWDTGDLNFDGSVSPADWTVFIANAETNLSGLSIAEAYQRGDLNGDGFNNLGDFIQFKTLYDVVNGAGAFEQMLANVPEPSSFVLLAGAMLATVGCRRRRADAGKLENHELSSPDSRIVSSTGVAAMPRLLACLLVVCVMMVFAAGAPVAKAAVLEDFTFSEPNDTPLDSVDNSINASNSWILGGNSWDPSAVLNGKYRITKSSAMQATAHIDMANVSTGKVWLVAELAGWNYTATPSATSEIVRFAFLDNDTSPPSGSTITAQMDIIRSGSALALVGNSLGTGFSNIAGSFALPLVRSTPFNIVLELDKNLDQYSVYYKDNTDPYQLFGTGNLGASTLNPGDRDGNSIRFAATGAFNDVGEFVDVDRIYLTNTSPIGGPVVPVALTLEAKSNGDVTIKNTTTSPISFDAYRITSATSALNFAGWNSLSDKIPLLNPVDGPDGGTTAGDGIGETWDEAGGSNDNVLAERFLLGGTTMAPNDSLSLGSAFKLFGDHNLTFEYHDTVSGAVAVGSLTYPIVAGVAGDYNNNGIVDTADYVVWRDNNNMNVTLPNDSSPGTVNSLDYDVWRANFGKTPASGSETPVNVPEPSALTLLVLGIALAAVRSRDRGAARMT